MNSQDLHKTLPQKYIIIIIIIVITTIIIVTIIIVINVCVFWFSLHCHQTSLVVSLQWPAKSFPTMAGQATSKVTHSSQATSKVPPHARQKSHAVCFVCVCVYICIYVYMYRHTYTRICIHDTAILCTLCGSKRGQASFTERSPTTPPCPLIPADPRDAYVYIVYVVCMA
jgi:hypothetical protein